MNKTEFINFHAQNNNLTNNEARTQIEKVIDSITQAIKENDELIITGFGKFYKNYSKAKKGINPKTKTKITIPAYTSAKFSAGKELKNAVNNR